MDFWQTFVFSRIVWNFLGFMVVTLVLGAYYQLNPKKIWQQYNSVNIFGCIILTICLNLLVPVISIGYWFYKLCTVGRKE